VRSILWNRVEIIFPSLPFPRGRGREGKG